MRGFIIIVFFKRVSLAYNSPVICLQIASHLTNLLESKREMGRKPDKMRIRENAKTLKKQSICFFDVRKFCISNSIHAL